MMKAKLNIYKDMGSTPQPVKPPEWVNNIQKNHKNNRSINEQQSTDNYNTNYYNNRGLIS